MRCRYSWVASKAFAKLLTIFIPVPRISTSSASMKQLIPAYVLMIMIHGLIMSATMVIEKGHPCGMPHRLRYGVPMPPARQL